MNQYDKSMRVSAEITFKRASRQFGTYLEENLVNAGIGPRLRTGNNFTSGFVRPNRFLYKERETITIAGGWLTYLNYLSKVFCERPCPLFISYVHVASFKRFDMLSLGRSR